MLQSLGLANWSAVLTGRTMGERPTHPPNIWEIFRADPPITVPSEAQRRNLLPRCSREEVFGKEPQGTLRAQVQLPSLACWVGCNSSRGSPWPCLDDSGFKDVQNTRVTGSWQRPLRSQRKVWETRQNCATELKALNKHCIMGSQSKSHKRRGASNVRHPPWKPTSSIPGQPGQVIVISINLTKQPRDQGPSEPYNAPADFKEYPTQTGRPRDWPPGQSHREKPPLGNQQQDMELEMTERGPTGNAYWRCRGERCPAPTEHTGLGHRTSVFALLAFPLTLAS